jgi:hypothetical protein
MKNLTDNNSMEMNTIVETYIIEETSALIYDNEKLDKWNDLVAKLELKGQTKIVTKDKSPIPFMHIKTSLFNVFSQLCPCKVNVETYDITPIPVEILDLIALSKMENYFTKVQIWYDDKKPDPACIGITSEYKLYSNYVKGVPEDLCISYPNKKEALKVAQQFMPELTEASSLGWETNERFYLIGRWADVKHSFEELKEMAKKRFIDEKGNEFRKQIKEAERGLIDLETEAFDKFN